MTIGFPQPRVRALLVASILVLSGLAGCGGGGGKPTTDGGMPKKDMGSGGQIGKDMGSAVDHTTGGTAQIGQAYPVGSWDHIDEEYLNE